MMIMLMMVAMMMTMKMMMIVVLISINDPNALVVKNANFPKIGKKLLRPAPNCDDYLLAKITVEGRLAKSPKEFQFL